MGILREVLAPEELNYNAYLIKTQGKDYKKETKDKDKWGEATASPLNPLSPILFISTHLTLIMMIF